MTKAQLAQEDTSVVLISGEIDEEQARHLMESLHYIHEESPTAPIEVIISSRGGTVGDGTAVYSTLAAMSERKGGTHHITTVVRGQCASIATLIYQAGDVRTGGKADSLLFHEPMMYFHGEWLSDAVQRVQDELKLQAMTFDVFMERATAPRSIIEKLEGPKDRVILMHEAVALGLADKVEGEHSTTRSAA